MKKVLVVVDMQTDFIDGALGTPEAVAVLPQVVDKIRAFDKDEIFVTYDTHFADYLTTLEGQKLPVPHCIAGTAGHDLHPAVKEALVGKPYREVIKTTFGSFEIAKILRETYPEENFEIELVGLCTDICVASNAILLRAAFPNAPIAVDARCCAGVTPTTHSAALLTMQSCQIDILNA